jgi:hypothetical protein
MSKVLCVIAAVVVSSMLLLPTASFALSAAVA